ncbi:hypothetical protein COO60DRAFT_1242830 [Scenedesmus sp. NREL 46B-D3]|nr:hypothetical protein COO60DRAFT_1242830 [Scenedesmus sp. NREL 46B-D3]
MNCSDPASAEAVVHRLPAQLERGMAHKLLLAAAALKHTAAMQQMLRLAAMQRHADAALVEAMLSQLLAHQESVQQLCALPAAEQLSSDAVSRLLLQAMQQRLPAAASQLQRLPAAGQLGTEQVGDLLQACVRACATDGHGWLLSDCLKWILRLPAIRELSSGAIVRVLNTAIDVIGESVVELGIAALRLLMLPAAATISGDDMAQLLQAALQRGSVSLSLLDGMWKLPAAVQLSDKTVVKLLRMAADPSRGYVTRLREFVEKLCRLPAAATISIDDMEHLLQAAAQAKPVLFTSFDYALVWALPAALELSADAIARLMRTILDASIEEVSESYVLVQRLLSLPAAATISSEDTGHLLQAAMQCKSDPWCRPLSTIMKLPAVVELNASAIVRAVCTITSINTDGYTAGRRDYVERLLRLPAAATISSEDTEHLLQAAIQRKPGVCFKTLDFILQLPAAVELSAGAIVRTISSWDDDDCPAIRCGYVKRLLRLPAAATISSQDTTHLLQAALERAAPAAVVQSAAAGPGGRGGD